MSAACVVRVTSLSFSNRWDREARQAIRAGVLFALGGIGPAVVAGDAEEVGKRRAAALGLVAGAARRRQPEEGEEDVRGAQHVVTYHNLDAPQTNVAVLAS